MLFDLVLIRIYQPCSKLRSLRILELQFGRTYGIDAAYRVLRTLAADPSGSCPDDKETRPTAKDRLLQKLHVAHTEHYESALQVVLYDVTTLYFESARDSDEYKVPGYSKDGKHTDPQILVGLLTNTDGFPLGYETFTGNTFGGRYSGGCSPPDS